MTMISTQQFRALFGALALLGAFAPQAWAAPLMTYQGRLKESGVPVNGNRNVDVLFCTCLSGACAPACASTGTQGVTISSGLFRTTFTVPASVDLAASQQWFLEVQVNATPLLPREELTAGPFAVYSSSSSSLVAVKGNIGVTISTTVIFTGGGIGPASPRMILGSPGGISTNRAMIDIRGLSRPSDTRSAFDDASNVYFKGTIEGTNAVGAYGFRYDGEALGATNDVYAAGRFRLDPNGLPSASIRMAALQAENYSTGCSNTGGDTGGGCVGVYALSSPATAVAGDSVGLWARGNNSTDRSMGVIGSAPTTVAGAKNYGVFGTAQNIGAAATAVGGYFELTATGAGSGSAALVANNNTTANPVFLGMVNSVEKFRIHTNGNVGINSPSPSLNLSLGNSSAQTFGVEDAGAITSPGNNLTVQAGAGGTLATGGQGGDMKLAAGNAGGTGNNNGGTIRLIPGDKTGGAGNMGAVEINGSQTAASAAHLRATQTTLPTIVTFGCGIANSANVTAGSTDMHGSVTLNTGAGVAAGCGVTITFTRAYGIAPKAVILTPSNNNASMLGVGGQPFVVGAAGGFNITTAVAPAASAALIWYYLVIE